MSEPKRIALIPLVAAEAASAPLPAKKDKKSPTNIVKTHRFSLTLPDSTEKSCPEFNFADLVSSLTKKKDGQPAATNGSAPSAGPIDPFADDDEDQLRGIAKKFEEKYGLPAAKKKKSRKYDDYVDLGAGYDENDPFIDNTDAYDEIVPAEVTTAHGGFYINSGALEFKPVEKRSDTESESESESSESDSDDSMSEASTTPVTSNKKRRVIESDDDDSPEEIQLNGSEGEDAEVKKKKLRLEETNNTQQAKRKKVSSPSDNGDVTSILSAKKPRPSVKELLQQKREVDKAVPESVEKTNKSLNNNVPVLPAAAVAIPATPSATTPTSATVKELLQLKRDHREKDVVVDLSVTSKAVVENNAATTESSSDSSDSDSSSDESESGGEDDEDGRDGDAAKGENDPDAKLPNNLTSATLTAIEDIKKAAAASDQQGKCRFFSPEVNRLLLAIELQARQYSCSKRQAIFTHLAGFLPCTKHTLLKRAKNLVLEDVESKLKPAIRKLQQAVEKVIGEQIERHASLCQRLAEANPERYLEYYRYVWDPELEPAGGTDDDEKKPEKSNRQPQPRRRFQWSKEIRAILNQVVYLKAECYNWSKLRKETAEEYLLRFLDSEIRLLWPKGWMTAKILFKESQEAHSFVTSKSKVTPIVGKKPIPPRTGLIDTLAPPPPAPPAPVTPSAISLQTSSSTPVGVTSKEVKKSQLKDRMLSSVAQQPVAQRPDSNSVHHRSDSAPNSSSGKADRYRSEVGASSNRSDNGGAKVEPNKHRQRSDTTGSSARTEIHQHIVKDSSKNSFRQAEVFHPNNHSRTADSMQPIHSNKSSDNSTAVNDSIKVRSETNVAPKVNTVQVRTDLGVITKTDISPHPARPNKVDSMMKPSRQEPSSQNSVVRVAESKPTSAGQILPKTDNAVPNKVEVVQSELAAAIVNSNKSDKLKSNKAPPPLTIPSVAHSSLASLVDSGLRWTESSGVLDLSDDQQQQQQPTRPSSKSAEATKESTLAAKTETETEDQESLLQRDLAMVLEEISQITRLVEGKDATQSSQHPTTNKSSDCRTKSVIKSTASIVSTVSAAAPVLTLNPSANSSSSSRSGSASVHPPKLTAATRTPPPPPLTISTPVSRMNSSPTGANNSINLISPTQTPSAMRTISPVSTTDQLKLGSALGKFNSSISKIIASEFMTPPTAHSSSRHAANFFAATDHISPEKRRSGSPQQALPPLPAHQQHASTTNTVPRSSPSTIFRNYPTSSAQANSTPSSSLAMRTSHSIESLIQTKKSPSELSSSAQRSTSNVHPGQQGSSMSQQQQLSQSSASKHDPLAVFMNQKNSQKGSHGDFNYYPQSGTGHQHSS